MLATVSCLARRESNSRRVPSLAHCQRGKVRFCRWRTSQPWSCMSCSRQDPKVVLVDVRTPEERGVSQIPGKVLTPEEFEKQKADFTDFTAVCYW